MVLHDCKDSLEGELRTTQGGAKFSSWGEVLWILLSIKILF